MLANDTDADGDALKAFVVDGPQHGRLCHNDDGSYSYRPTAGDSGADGFAYTVSDGTLGTTATITLNVNHDDDSDCGYQATVEVQSEPQVFDNANGRRNGRRLVLARHRRTSSRLSRAPLADSPSNSLQADRRRQIPFPYRLFGADAW